MSGRIGREQEGGGDAGKVCHVSCLFGGVCACQWVSFLFLFLLFLFHSTTPAHTSPLSFTLVPSLLRKHTLRVAPLPSRLRSPLLHSSSLFLALPVYLSHYLPRPHNRGARLPLIPLLCHICHPFSLPFCCLSPSRPSIPIHLSSRLPVPLSFIASLARVFCVCVSTRTSSSQLHCSQSLLDQ